MAPVILMYCTSKLVTATGQDIIGIINPPRDVYCDMEQQVVCGNIGGWTRIASVNITRGDECPTGWNKRSQDGISFCRSPSDNAILL